VIRDENTVVNNDDTIIEVSEKSLNKLDAKGTHQIKRKLIGIDEDVFITKSKIFIDWIACQEDEYIAYCALVHEFGHALGLGDVYYKGDSKVCDYLDNTTFMSPYRNEEIDIFYPNDYALMQVLYSREYEKYDNYQDAVDVVNKKIKTYTTKFYRYYIEKMKERYSITDELKNVEFSGELYSFVPGKEYFVKFLDDSKCEVTVRKFDGSESRCLADAVFVDGVVFLKNVRLDGLDSSFSFEKSLWSIYADERGNIIINDGQNMWNTSVVKSVKNACR